MAASPEKHFWQPGSDVDVAHSSNRASIAFDVVRTNWPKLVSAVAESVEIALDEVCQDAEVVNEGRAILDRLTQFRLEIEKDSPILLLSDDGGDDVKDYNAELTMLKPISWHNSPWLYAECYFFRRLHACVTRSTLGFWQNFDIWARQKLENMRLSDGAIHELVEWFLALRTRLWDVGEEMLVPTTDRRTALEDLLQVSLWGNTADLLSLLTISTEELHSRQHAQVRKQFKDNVVVDDTFQVVNFLEQLRGGTHRHREINVVLDNSGFELISDLVLVAYLLCGNYVDRVVLHAKGFPWYVSDATRNDFNTVLPTLSSPRKLPTEHQTLAGFDSLPMFAELVNSLLSTEPPRLILKTDAFWTTAHPFARLPTFATGLFESLRHADLVIFKGDLNYRKLIADALWDPTTPFAVAIGPLRDMGLRILALRTCKSDACVGLDEGQVAKIDPDKTGEWTANGKYGVISFFDGTSEKTHGAAA